MTLEEAKKKLYSHEKLVSAYNHAMGLINYDGMTYAPKDTAANRGQTLAQLGEVSYELSTSAEYGELLDFISENRNDLDPMTARIVDLNLKNLRELRKIPMEEYIAYNVLINEASDVWHRAKLANDFPMFQPYLEKIIASIKKVANYVAPEKKPYDYWVDCFEEGMTVEKFDAFFDGLRREIVPLLKEVTSKPQVDRSLSNQIFPISGQEKLSDYLMELMLIDRGHCTIATTEHPFTTNFSKYDVRITTHYHDDAFLSSLYSVVHEGGHALYELHTDDKYAYTCLGNGVSMGIHESQSRFYENIIGRSREYLTFIFPKLCELFPEQTKGRTPEEFYRAANLSEPSLIRTEADELTYSLHIMIRYEIEKALMEDSVKVSELPALWNKLYKEYLGIDVPSDREGVLQDSHWSGGLFGYFPSYALGSAYGAQILAKMEKDVDVFGTIAKGDFAPVNNWLCDKIWRHGSFYNPTQLIENVLGEKFDSKYYTDYLRKKYSEIYSL